MSSDQSERSVQPVLPSLERSLAAGSTEQQDEGARSLALRYGALLDDAVAEQKYAKALRLVGEAVEERADHMPVTSGQQLMDAWDRLSTALAEHSVASDLGPKLLATLTALGCTPAGRAEKKGGAGGGSLIPAANPLLQQREDARRAREARERAAAAGA